MTGRPMWQEDYEAFVELRNFAIAYVQYVESGGKISDFTSIMIDKTIDVVMKLKYNRDKHYKYCGKDIPIYENGEKIKIIIN